LPACSAARPSTSSRTTIANDQPSITSEWKVSCSSPCVDERGSHGAEVRARGEIERRARLLAAHALRFGQRGLIVETAQIDHVETEGRVAPHLLTQPRARHQKTGAQDFVARDQIGEHLFETRGIQRPRQLQPERDVQRRRAGAFCSCQNRVWQAVAGNSA
jgi:hypothetical protein